MAFCLKPFWVKWRTDEDKFLLPLFSKIILNYSHHIYIKSLLNQDE